jgi:hypothetical protein
VSFEHLFRKQLARSKIIGEKVNETAVLTKNLPFLPREFLRKFDQLEVSRRLVQFKSRHRLFCGNYGLKLSRWLVLRRWSARR